MAVADEQFVSGISALRLVVLLNALIAEGPTLKTFPKTEEQNFEQVLLKSSICHTDLLEVFRD